VYVLDRSLEEPALNLALDEALLNAVERGECGDVLRFWESASPFVVLGTSQKIRQEVHLDACEQDGVPVTRRCSAGGCVLQGPGSLNFSLALRLRDDLPDLKSVRTSYCYILCRVSAALASLGVEARHQGISDVAIGGQKVSGNSQKRRRNAILHHGTLLHGMDPALFARYLREPEDRPEYRGFRTHEQFVTQLTASGTALREAVSEQFAARRSFDRIDAVLAEAEQLAASRYRTKEWVYRR
jgi:lipoate-protein ligase A